MTLSKSDVVRNVREHLEPMMVTAGFQQKGTTVYWRVRDNLLQYISLELPSGRFTVEVAIQPLFVPNDHLVFAFGGRLGRFVNGLDHWFDISHEEALATGLRQSAAHIQQYAFPWFDRLDNVRSLTDWFSQGGTAIGGPHGSGLFGRLPIYLGYCHAYLQEFSAAIPLIEQNLTEAIRPEWPDFAPTAVLLAALKTEPEKVASMLDDWTAYTVEKLKIR